jgi:hypothetical protein
MHTLDPTNVIWIENTVDHIRLWTIDLSKIFKVHHIISMRYEPHFTFINHNPKKIISTIDRYAMQLIEEIDEYMDEHSPDLQKLEMLDIIGYSITMFHIIDSYLNTMSEDYRLRPKSTISLLDSVKCEYTRCEYTSKVLSYIIKGRRQFPERKWHKTYDKATPLIVYDRLNNYRKELLDLIEYHFVMWNAFYGMDDFQRLYESKINTIKNTFI